MNIIVPHLENLKYEELCELKNLIVDEIQYHEDQNLIESIRNDIMSCGYAWDDYSLDEEVCNENILSVDFPIHKHLYKQRSTRLYGFHDNESYEIIEVLDNKQNDWFHYLGSNCYSFKIEGINYWSYDKPCGEKITMKKIYYCKSPKPKNKSFKCFDENGNIKNWQIVNDKLYCDNVYFGELDKWDTYGLFVLNKTMKYN